jgi:hypothetical protein
MSSQSPEAPTRTISGLPNIQFGSPGKKSHLDATSAVSCRIYYKGEGGGFLQVRAMVSLMCPCCPWLILAPRVLQLCTTHFVWVVCRPVWVSEACQLFLVPSRSSNTPFYPSKCCELGNVHRLLLLPMFPTWAHIWVLWKVGGASIDYCTIVHENKNFASHILNGLKTMYIWCNVHGSANCVSPWMKTINIIMFMKILL